MLFLHPMWDNESERLGKKQCTPLGYALHIIAELVGFIGLILLVGTGAYLAYRGVVGTFRAALLWLLTVPFGIGLISEVLYGYSWMLAVKKGFNYDCETREASWMEDGRRRVYKWRA